MSHRKTAIAVGILFFVQIITYALGAASIRAFENGETTARPTMGVLLTTLSGLAIVGIGLLMYPVLSRSTGRSPLGTRCCGSSSSRSRRRAGCTC